MSTTRLNEMTDKFFDALSYIDITLSRFGVRLPVPNQHIELNLLLIQKGLYRAQCRIEHEDFISSRGLTNRVVTRLGTMLHNGLVATDQIHLYSREGAFDWRSDAFEKHTLDAIVDAAAVQEMADNGTAWGMEP